MKKVVVLLSGGLDSATVLALAREQGLACYALSFRYGQRHEIELQAAACVAQSLGAVDHRTVTIDLGWIGGSALTADISVPKNRSTKEPGVPVTYVPARNTIFLSYALAWAEVLGARDIFIGANAVDYSGYPDCRPEFLAAFQQAARLGTRIGDLIVHAPLVVLSKAEIIREGARLGVDYSLTHSCYDPVSGALACGQCDSCQIRRRGFIAAGVTDPTVYAPQNGGTP